MRSRVKRSPLEALVKLTIAQIENPGPGRLRKTIEFDGSLAPLDSLAFGVSQRAEIEWLPGSDVASVRLDGGEETPTEARFVWKGRRFTPGEAKLDGTYILDLDTLVQALSDFVRDRALVDVTWRGRTQRAVLQAFEPEEGDRAFEWTASLTFAWVAPPGRRARVAAPSVSPPSFAARLQASFDEGMAEVETLVTFLRGPVDDAAAGVSRVRENLQRFENAALSLLNVAQSVAGVFKAIADTIQQLFTTTEDVQDALAVSSDQLAQTDDAFAQIRARRYRTQQLRVARVARYQAALERRNYRPEADVLAVHEGVDGDTIWSVSRLWYGTPDLAWALARRNGLISTAIRSGQRLIIPRRAAADEPGGRARARIQPSGGGSGPRAGGQQWGKS